MHKKYLAIGSLLGLLAVMLGAFGAHALRDNLIERGSVDTWKTAVNYQMWHALALLLWLTLSTKDKPGTLTGNLFILGVCLFSGSLYWLALGGPAWLWPATPLGGLLLMGGWGNMAISALKSQ